MKRAKSIPLYWIEWWDAFDPKSRWYELGEDLDAAVGSGFLCVTVGFFVRETADYLLVAQTLGSGASQALNVLNVPKGCIKKKLKIGRLDV